MKFAGSWLCTRNDDTTLERGIHCTNSEPSRPSSRPVAGQRGNRECNINRSIRRSTTKSQTIFKSVQGNRHTSGTRRSNKNSLESVISKYRRYLLIVNDPHFSQSTIKVIKHYAILVTLLVLAGDYTNAIIYVKECIAIVKVT